MMVVRAGVVCALVAGVAHADLYATGTEDGFFTTYFRISTTDASVEFLSSDPGGPDMIELALGPDGRYYAVSLDSLFEVDPIDAFADLYDCYCGQQFLMGSLAVSGDGLLHVGVNPFFRDQNFIDLVDARTGDSAGFIPISDKDILIALAIRPDGTLIATKPDDPTIYEVDQETGALTALGQVDPDLGWLLSFATDPSNGQTYVLSSKDGIKTLSEIDLETFETTLVGDVAQDVQIQGIAGIACAADFNGDGELNVLDFVAFQIAWQAGDERADVNGDGVLDVLDFVAFQGVFLEGCR